jgi:hypothetical protein
MTNLVEIDLLRIADPMPLQNDLSWDYRASGVQGVERVDIVYTCVLKLIIVFPNLTPFQVGLYVPSGSKFSESNS